MLLCQGGNTPLHWAALKGHADSVKLMMQCADIAVVVRMQDEVSDKW